MDVIVPPQCPFEEREPTHDVISKERDLWKMSFRGALATPNVISGVMAKNVCCFFIFLDKRTSQKMLYVLEKKALDDHDNGFS